MQIAQNYKRPSVSFFFDFQRDSVLAFLIKRRFTELMTHALALRMADAKMAIMNAAAIAAAIACAARLGA